MVKQKKAILRVVFYPKRFTVREELSVFDGDIKKDKIYWKKYHNTKTRYFKLEEV